MVQRVQTLLLLLVAILHILLFFIPVFVWNDEVGNSKTITALFNTPLITINALIILFSIFIISLFKNRKKQRLFTFVLSIIIILNIGLYMIYMVNITVINEYELLPLKSIGIYLQLMSLILCFITAKRIKKDDELVKSVDRIR